MIDRFEELLTHFGQALDLSLHTDKNGACAIFVKGTIIQLQPDPTYQKLIIGCKIIEVAPGKFRENVFREALKANGLPDPRAGIFSYIPQVNMLFFFQEYPFDILTTGDRVASIIGPFLKLTDSWRKAIEMGQPGPK